MRPTTCPSARCEPGARLLGVVDREGIVGFFDTAPVIDESFVRVALAGSPPQQRFRFAQPCVQAACKQWTGTRCGVIDAAIDAVDPEAVSTELRDCAIRESCRWFRQRGPEACQVCPLVITDASRRNLSRPEGEVRVWQASKKRDVARVPTADRADGPRQRATARDNSLRPGDQVERIVPTTNRS